MFVFLISDNPVLAPALELAAKQRGERLYRMETLTEALFFIVDLRPEVVVLDGALVPATFSWTTAVEEFPTLATVAWVALGKSWPAAAGAPDPRCVVSLPVDPFVFHETLAAKLTPG